MTTAAVPHSSAPRPQPAARLLLVDDSPQELSQLTRLLADQYRLLYASDGLSGFHRALSQHPDLILLDVEMPELDGHAVCRLLRAEPSTQAIPVIFLSAHGSAPERLAGLQAGAVDYISKPFLAEEVIARVKVHLRRAASEDEGAPEGRALHEDPERVFVRAAITLIQQHLAALPSVARIAQQVGLGERRLSDLFRKHLGLTVSGFISEERVRAGQRLLAETMMPVGEVSAEVGYVNAASFSAAFRERLGVTPQQWRQAQRRLNEGDADPLT